MLTKQVMKKEPNRDNFNTFAHKLVVTVIKIFNSFWSNQSNIYRFLSELTERNLSHLKITLLEN